MRSPKLKTQSDVERYINRAYGKKNVRKETHGPIRCDPFKGEFSQDAKYYVGDTFVGKFSNGGCFVRMKK